MITNHNPSQQQILINRKFNCLQRNKHYEKSYMLFLQLQNNLKKASPDDQDKKIPAIHSIEDFCAELKSALNFSKLATRPYNRERLKAYNVDREYGVLREEFIFVVFLEEMYSSINYILNRIKTDVELHLFAIELESYQKMHQDTGNSSQAGFVTNVLKSLGDLKDSDKNHIEKIFDSINQRYQVGNKVFSLIREMQKV